MDLVFAWLREVNLSGVIDISIIMLVVYSILVWMKRRKRAAAILTGILVVAAVYLLARQFNLYLTAAVLQGFFAIIIVVLVVIFQEELRYFFEQVAHWSLNRRLPLQRQKHSLPSAEEQEISTLVSTVRDLAREKIGALIVLKGKDILARHLDGGETLDGRLSEPILKSIFDTHSIGHDGAVLIDGGIIESFGCHLPLSKNFDKLRHGGTRHAAALGLSELSDSLCLVVSEERGTISVARHGDIEEVSESAKLEAILGSFYAEFPSAAESRPWQDFFKKNSREKFLAFGMALALWFVLIHEAAIVYRSYAIPVEFSQLPEQIRIVRVEPSEVEVTLSGQRKSFFLFRSDRIRMQIKPWNLKAGTKEVKLSDSDFIYDGNFVIENVEPREILLQIEDRATQNQNIR